MTTTTTKMKMGDKDFTPNTSYIHTLKNTDDILFDCTYCSKKKMKASRPSEHTPVRREIVVVPTQLSSKRTSAFWRKITNICIVVPANGEVRLDITLGGKEILYCTGWQTMQACIAGFIYYAQSFFFTRSRKGLLECHRFSMLVVKCFKRLKKIQK